MTLRNVEWCVVLIELEGGMQLKPALPHVSAGKPARLALGKFLGFCESSCFVAKPHASIPC